MFGKPQWFRKKTVGWGLVPTCWQGWLYTAGWGATVAIPFFGLLTSGLGIEALIWGAVVGGAFLIDVRKVLRATSTGAESEVLVIDDDRAGSQLNTRRFDMRLRD